MENKKTETEYVKIFAEYDDAQNFKTSIGQRGLYEQSKMNERFYIGDQWHGANCGNERPLLRHNVIKRIGDYKVAMISASPLSVNYSAEGVPNTVGIKDTANKYMDGFENGEEVAFDETSNEGISFIMAALSDYFRVTAERLQFDGQKEQALRNAYISGTGLIYTYWDSNIETGLYADESKTKAIKGDIQTEIIDIENVYYGNPNCMKIQDQPWIIISQRRMLKDVIEEARANKVSEADIACIKPDDMTSYEAGDYGNKEQKMCKKVTVLTKLYKVDDGGKKTVKAIKVVKGAVIRPEWDLGIRLYPLADFKWERRRNNAYGESEITYLIPNQIAINRMLTAQVWAVMMLGMPMMAVNDSMLTDDEIVSGIEPGKVIHLSGGADEVYKAIQYVNPPQFSPNYESNINSLIGNTLTQSGANDAALGDIRPENTSAIIAVREAASLPLQTVQNRFYQFIEDVARIWAEFWISLYGKRSLKMEDNGNTFYVPFDGDKYKNLLVSAKIDVGASTLYGEAQTISTLDNLLERGVVNIEQYLERLPQGTVPNKTRLLRDLKEQQMQAQEQQEMIANQPIPNEEILAGLTDEEREQFAALSPEEQQMLLEQAQGQGGAV